MGGNRFHMTLVAESISNPIMNRNTVPVAQICCLDCANGFDLKLLSVLLVKEKLHVPMRLMIDRISDPQLTSQLPIPMLLKLFYHDLLHSLIVIPLFQFLLIRLPCLTLNMLTDLLGPKLLIRAGFHELLPFFLLILFE